MLFKTEEVLLFYFSLLLSVTLNKADCIGKKKSNCDIKSSTVSSTQVVKCFSLTSWHNKKRLRDFFFFPTGRYKYSGINVCVWGREEFDLSVYYYHFRFLSVTKVLPNDGLWSIAMPRHSVYSTFLRHPCSVNGRNCWTVLNKNKSPSEVLIYLEKTFCFNLVIQLHHGILCRRHWARNALIK